MLLELTQCSFFCPLDWFTLMRKLTAVRKNAACSAILTKLKYVLQTLFWQVHKSCRNGVVSRFQDSTPYRQEIGNEISM